MAKSPSCDAIYKGLAIASTCGATRIYATDFHNIKVDVFDDQWNVVTMPSDAFLVSRVPRAA